LTYYYQGEKDFPATGKEGSCAIFCDDEDGFGFAVDFFNGGNEKEADVFQNMSGEGFVPEDAHFEHVLSITGIGTDKFKITWN